MAFCVCGRRSSRSYSNLEYVNYLAEILFVIVNIAMAKHHANLILKDKPIKHGWWGLLYLIIAGVVCYYLKSWWLFTASLVLRKVVFDAALNLFRGKALFYVSSSPKSIVDIVHYKIFGKYAELYVTFYAVVLLMLNVFALR